MNVLSLFDGMSCGQIALERVGIKVDNYFASEIDKYAIKVTQKNYLNTIQLGDVAKVHYKNKDLIWNNGRNFKETKIDLLIAGSPCQGFSRAGKGLNFEDPRSKLFFDFVRLLKETSPKYFLLENVKMKKEYQDIISKYLEVEPILINSALVSAQQRKRLYWTNIPNIAQPEEKGHLLKDIIDDKLIDKSSSFLSGKFKEFCRINKIDNFMSCNGKLVELYPEMQYLANERRVNKTRPLLSKSTCLTCSSISIAGSGGIGLYINGKHRRISRNECERLQTVPVNYTSDVSVSQAIKMLGNGWTVDVIAHIFKNIDY